MTRDLLAIYPGTFDPLTLGHQDIVQRASGLFPQLIVGVAEGHHKTTLFDHEERVAMVREVFKAVGNIRVMPFSGLLRDFVVAQNASVVVRGLRTAADFDYEFQLAGMNRLLMPEVETVFLTPSEHYQFISSTLVREIARLGGEVDQFVPSYLKAQLQRKVQR